MRAATIKMAGRSGFRAGHLLTTAGASFGDLLLINGLRRVRLRVGVGPLPGDDLDLTLAADRGQVIDWLRWIE